MVGSWGVQTAQWNRASPKYEPKKNYSLVVLLSTIPFGRVVWGSSCIR